MRESINLRIYKNGFVFVTTFFFNRIIRSWDGYLKKKKKQLERKHHRHSHLANGPVCLSVSLSQR